jgi:hypothetical protein
VIRPASGLARLAGLFAAALLGGCGWLGAPDPLERAANCPQGLVLADAGAATIFRDGPGRDLTDIVAVLRIADVVVDCRRERRGVTVDLQVAVTAERGPANRSGRHDADYFVAVVDAQGNVLQRESFRIGFAWPENRLRVGSVEDLEPRIALASPDRAGEYRIWVGLQLTAEQLAWNRSGAARR